MIFFIIVITFLANVSYAQYSGNSWQIEQIPIQEVDSLYNKIITFTDSLDEHFFTLSKPYNQYIFLFQGSEYKKDMALFQVTTYKKDSSQTFAWMSKKPFSQDKHVLQTRQLTTDVYDEYSDGFYKQRNHQRIEIDQNLKTGKWYQRPLGKIDEPLTHRDSIAFLIRRVNGKVDILLVSIRTGKEFLFSNDAEEFPDFNLKKWQSLF